MSDAVPFTYKHALEPHRNLWNKKGLPILDGWWRYSSHQGLRCVGVNMHQVRMSSHTHIHTHIPTPLSLKVIQHKRITHFGK